MRLRVVLLLVFAGVSSLAAPGVWIDVPFVAQKGKQCGAATVLMLLRYWSGKGYPAGNADATAEALHRRLYSREKGGAPGEELKRLLEESGFEVFVFRGEYSDLERHLAKGRPLAVCLDLSPGNSLHYALVVGLDPAADVVLLNDPARRKLAQYGRREFLDAWEAAGFWTLLAAPAGPR